MLPMTIGINKQFNFSFYLTRPDGRTSLKATIKREQINACIISAERELFRL
jgi:hypothetical protein